jgi:hypothetical protein
MSTRLRWLTLVTVFVLLPSAGSAANPVAPVYQREQNLQQTLLATRQRYAAWLAEQPAARAAVEFSPWRTTAALPSADGRHRLECQARRRPRILDAAERMG